MIIKVINNDIYDKILNKTLILKTGGINDTQKHEQITILKLTDINTIDIKRKDDNVYHLEIFDKNGKNLCSYMSTSKDSIIKDKEMILSLLTNDTKFD